MRDNRNTLGKGLIKILAFLIITALVLGILMLGILTITEYRPKDEESVLVRGDGSYNVRQTDEIRLVTWNIGYGALDASADFFMDGGKGVMTADEAGVQRNMEEIVKGIQSLRPDVLLLQEVDVNSKRSHHIDESKMVMDVFPGYASTFAYNYKAPFVPFPVPPIGKVGSGLLTVSGYPIKSASRVQLYCPFKWPIRTANLKRGISVHRIELGWTDKEFVVMNLHLEAYDSGEGKKIQAEQLANLINQEVEKGNYVVAGGDFNQIFPTVDWSAYPMRNPAWMPGELDISDFDPSLQFVMDPSAPTCRSLEFPYAGSNKNEFQYYMIDGFIVSKNIEILEATTQDFGFEYTDHNPVVLRIRLK